MDGIKILYPSNVALIDDSANVCGRTGVFVLQIQRLDIESAMKCATVFHPVVSKRRSGRRMTRHDFRMCEVPQARQNRSRKTYHRAVQSKCTISHLDGLKAIESALSTPFSQPRCSGQTNELPAYAASTCTHTLCFRHTSVICR